MKLFLDANVLFTAAHNPAGKAALIIELGRSGCWSLVTSHYAVEEARRNLERKFPRSSARLESLLESVRQIRNQPGQPFPDGLPPKDQPIFQAALASGASHLITGDLKDFGPLMNMPEQTHGIIVQSASDFLERLSE